MTRAGLRPIVIKEIRALLPVWTATLCAVGAAAWSAPRGHSLGLVAYGFGTVALGAQSIGHEYTYRTLIALLAQPVSRRRLLSIKFSVLTMMALALAAIARVALIRPDEVSWIVASLVCTFFLAPMLTMACRGPLAAIVFVGAAPVWASAFSEVVSPAVLWGTTLAICVPTAIETWRLFMHLEAIDGRGADLQLPRTWDRQRAAGATGSARHPLWLVAKKELHLQQMTFAVGAVWLAIWIATLTLGRLVPTLTAFPVDVVSVLYGVLLALLIGALASAEERQLGTLEWQMLQPVAAWQQWAVKVGMVTVLAAVLSFALPVVLAARQVGSSAPYAAVILTLTIGSLYVSSLCRNSIRALTIAAPILLGLLALWTYAAGIYSIGYHGEHLRALTAVPLTAIVALMLWFGLENHRTAAQGSVRVVRQVLWMVACVALGVAVVAAT